MKNITFLTLASITLLGCQQAKKEKNNLNGIWFQAINIDDGIKYNPSVNDLIDIENGTALKVRFNSHTDSYESISTDTLVLNEKDSLISLLNKEDLTRLKTDTNRSENPFEGMFKYTLNNDSLTIKTKYRTLIYFRLKEKWKSNNEFKLNGEYRIKGPQQDYSIEFVDDSIYFVFGNWNWVEKYPFRKYKIEKYKGYQFHCSPYFNPIEIITGSIANPTWVTPYKNEFFKRKLEKVSDATPSRSILGKWIATERKTYKKAENSDSLVLVKAKGDIPMPPPPANYKATPDDTCFTITFKSDSVLINRYRKRRVKTWKLSCNQKRILFDLNDNGRLWEIKELSDSIMKVQMNSFDSFLLSQDIFTFKKIKN